MRTIKILNNKIFYFLWKLGRSHTQSWKYCNIIIRGDSDFYDITKNAIDLIKEKDFVNYNRVLRNIREIIYDGDVDSGTGGVYTYIKIYFVGKLTLSHGIKWYASTLVHESIHIILWNKRIRASKMAKEKACTKAQIRSLIRLGEDVGNPKEYLNRMLASEWWTPRNRWKEYKKYNKW